MSESVEKLLIYIALALFFAIAFVDCAMAETIEGYEIERLAESIYKAEGGKKAKKPYGILSIPCEGREHCGRICRNTIRNNLRRWARNGQKQPFIEFLGARYAPIGANNDNGTNKHWIGNVSNIYASMG